MPPYAPGDRIHVGIQRLRIKLREKTMNREDQFIPHLVVSDGLAALESYKTAFAAEEGDRMMAADEFLGKRG